MGQQRAHPASGRRGTGKGQSCARDLGRPDHRGQNKAEHTEVEILAYPLDDSQRPQANDVGNGRFIAVIPGYVEPLDYPVGGWVTLQGTIQGVRSDHVGKAPYVFPLVRVRAAHVFSREEMQRRSNVHVSLGVGIGVH